MFMMWYVTLASKLYNNKIIIKLIMIPEQTNFCTIVTRVQDLALCILNAWHRRYCVCVCVCVVQGVLCVCQGVCLCGVCSYKVCRCVGECVVYLVEVVGWLPQLSL